MMKIAMTAEIKELERRAIEEYGISPLVLMENAGVEVVRQIEQLLGDLHNKKVCIFSGKGNNGGDGFVAARHLYNQGTKVKVFLLGGRHEMKPEAAANLAIIERMDIDVMEIAGERDWDKARLASSFADCLVDALVGTGFSGSAEGLLARLISLLNRSGKPIVAVDVPSGIRADNGLVGSEAVKAVHTITFGLPKPGLFLYPGAAYSGSISVADIGLPLGLLREEAIRQSLLLAEDVKKMLPQRKADAHKGECGHVLLIAGSEGYAGAALLAAEGALRAGAGLVTLAVPRSIYQIVAAQSVEVMVQPLPDEGAGFIGLEALVRLAELVENADVVAVGPGLGRREETLAVIKDLLESLPCPAVIDADALAAFADSGKLALQMKSPPVLTPHPGEFSRMTGLSISEINASRVVVARRFAEEWGAVIALKGARTIVAFPDGEVNVNLSGNAAMASGGMGDVLTGMIAAFIGQGLSSQDAALTGVHVHGASGDRAAQGKAKSVAARELAAAISGVLAEM